MLQKNIDKDKRKERRLWTGFFTRRTPSKKEKEERNHRKHKERSNPLSILFRRDTSKLRY